MRPGYLQIRFRCFELRILCRLSRHSCLETMWKEGWKRIFDRKIKVRSQIGLLSEDVFRQLVNLHERFIGNFSNQIESKVSDTDYTRMTNREN